MRTTAAGKVPKGPCSFYAGNNWTEPSCYANEDFTASIPSAAGMSGWARTLIQSAASGIACAKYSTPATCNADLTNYCDWDPETKACYSYLEGVQTARDVFCPGSPMARLNLCRAKLREDCGKGADRSQPDADGCVVSDYVAYGGKSDWETYHAEDETVYGYPLRQGRCFLSEEVAARLGPDLEFNTTQFQPWFKAQNGDPNNITDYLRARGNCSYTLNSIARVAYSTKCSSYNNGFADTSKTLPALKTTSDKALKCAASGCAIGIHNGTTIAEYYRNYPKGVQAVFYRCEASTPFLWTTRLNAQTDGVLYRQYQLCHSPYLQRSKALCEAAVLA